jgi:hypothetical protein
MDRLLPSGVVTLGQIADRLPMLEVTCNLAQHLGDAIGAAGLEPLPRLPGSNDLRMTRAYRSKDPQK